MKSKSLILDEVEEDREDFENSMEKRDDYYDDKN